jgi:hypothetical protein
MWQLKIATTTRNQLLGESAGYPENCVLSDEALTPLLPPNFAEVVRKIPDSHWEGRTLKLD